MANQNMQPDDEYADLRNTSSPYADGRRNPDDDTRSSDYPMGSPAGYYTVQQPTSGAGSNPNSGGAGTFFPGELVLAEHVAVGIDDAARQMFDTGPGGTSPTAQQYASDEGVNDAWTPESERR